MLRRTAVRYDYDPSDGINATAARDSIDPIRLSPDFRNFAWPCRIRDDPASVDGHQYYYELEDLLRLSAGGGRGRNPVRRWHTFTRAQIEPVSWPGRDTEAEMERRGLLGHELQRIVETEDLTLASTLRQVLARVRGRRVRLEGAGLRRLRGAYKQHEDNAEVVVLRALLDREFDVNRPGRHMPPLHAALALSSDLVGALLAARPELRDRRWRGQTARELAEDDPYALAIAQRIH